MVREQIKTDYTEDEIKNLENKKCWCGKPRSEFDKGMRVYCCADHRSEWYSRTISWGELKNNFLDKKGKKCAKCGCTPESLKKGEKSEFKDWLKLVKANPAAMKIVEQVRLKKLKDVEEMYEKAMDDDYIIKWEFGFRHSEGFKGIPPAPQEDSFLSERFEVDHILAICNGGDQWDEKNFQVLCYADHKLKTKEDMKLFRSNKK